MGGGDIYCLRHVIYCRKPVLWLPVYGNDRKSRGYFFADQLPDDGNEFKFRCIKRLISGTLTGVFRQQSVYRRRLYKIDDHLRLMLDPAILFCLRQSVKKTLRPQGGTVKVPVSHSIKYCLTNKPLMIIFALMIIAMTAFFGRMAVVLYYILYVLERPDLISIFMALPSVMTIIGIFVTKNYILKFGKKEWPPSAILARAFH